MAVLPVVALPDPILKQRCAEVVSFDADLRRFVDDLVETMQVSPACVGLAANQVGVSLRVFAMDVSGHKKARSCHGLVVLVNPEVVERSATELAREGCMSVPDLTGDVPRSTDLVIRGVDGLDPEWSERVLHCDAFEARAVQHELDHLDGLLFLDRVGGPKALFPRKVYR